MGAKRHAQLGGLTIAEEKMVQLYTNGGKGYAGNMSACYEEAYQWTGERHSLWTHASVKFREPHIQERVRELLNIYTSPEYVKSKLHELSNESERDSDKIRATELLGKTHALFIDKNETEVTISALALDEDDTDESVAS